MRRTLVLACLVFWGASGAHSQADEKTSIAVLPFINNAAGKGDYCGIMQEMVTKEFVKGNRFAILDRSKFQKVLDELKVQKSEEFLNSKVVEQGKVMGAQYLVTGVLNQADAKKEVGTAYDPYLKQNKITTKWTADLRFSFQVINVATSSAVYAENISATNGTNHTDESNDAMENAMCQLKKQVRNAVMKLFPQEIMIVSVEKANKKGLPELVLISAGSNFFGEDYKGGDECETAVMDKVLGFLKKKEKVKLKVVEIETLTVNGTEKKREKTIGTLKLEKVEGDFSVCEVDEGEKEIGERLNAQKKLLVKIM